MTQDGFDYWGKRDWLKRIHQLKKELRSATSDPSLIIPQPVKASGTHLNPKQIRPSGKQPALKARSLPKSPIELAATGTLNGTLKKRVSRELKVSH